MTIKGAMVAATVAGLFAAAAPAVVQAKGGGKVMCTGANACKGKGACKGADNDCKGKNACKGKGYVDLSSADECAKKGGKVIEPKKM